MTLELWKPCLPETPVFRLWLAGCFLLTILYKPEKNELCILLCLEHSFQRDVFIYLSSEFVSCFFILIVVIIIIITLFIEHFSTQSTKCCFFSEHINHHIQ